MELMEILSLVSEINRDNGINFTNTDRLDAIAALLQDNSYRRVNSDGLFHLYSQKTLEELAKETVIVVSSHVDCQRRITRCFTSELEEGLLRGTYDNAITNAAAVAAMLSGDIPENVLIAFTGDEEEEAHGAEQLLKFLDLRGIDISAIVVLDVTDMGWTELADYTIENNFWNSILGKKAVSIAQSMAYPWRFVPEDVEDIPDYVPSEVVINEEAEQDESWYYDEENRQCFSLCLPVKGNMHSDEGVLARKSSFYRYSEALITMLQGLALNP